MRPLLVGNWKMHGLGASLGEIARLLEMLDAHPVAAVDILICPPATLLSRAREALASGRVGLGGQDCHPEPSGAHTGDISAEMLADAGATAVIVGHSERRIDHGETDALVAKKAAAAHRAGLAAIICVGETAAERRNGAILEVVGRQLSGSLPEGAASANTVIAYEPVWAIGTGLTPEPADIAQAHGFIRKALDTHFGKGQGEAVRILYGGSVKPANAASLLTVPEVNGALVGGASLRAAEFYGILATYAPNPVF
jgi:triosephosphate isomerase (TIM)